jgi:hypothetical protein
MEFAVFYMYCHAKEFLKIKKGAKILPHLNYASIILGCVGGDLKNGGKNKFTTHRLKGVNMKKIMENYSCFFPLLSL